MVPTEQAQKGSPLFLVRLWSDEDSSAEPGTGDAHWRGKVLHIPTGEAHYFSTWASLVDFLGLIFLGHGDAPMTSPSGDASLNHDKP